MANITRVPFIGNNFTACNDLPDLLARLVSGGGAMPPWTCLCVHLRPSADRG